jgi:hypothetical protein
MERHIESLQPRRLLSVVPVVDAPAPKVEGGETLADREIVLIEEIVPGGVIVRTKSPPLPFGGLEEIGEGEAPTAGAIADAPAPKVIGGETLADREVVLIEEIVPDGVIVRTKSPPLPFDIAAPKVDGGDTLPRQPLYAGQSTLRASSDMFSDEDLDLL